MGRNRIEAKLNRPCEGCGGEMPERRVSESITQYMKRRYCKKSCYHSVRREHVTAWIRAGYARKREEFVEMCHEKNVARRGVQTKATRLREALARVIAKRNRQEVPSV